MAHTNEHVEIEKHSLNFVEMTYGMEKRERMENPDGYGKRTGECGDTIEVFLAIEDNRITRATFDIDGCEYTQATGNTAVHLCEGKSVEQAWEISIVDIIVFLCSLPQDHYHCAELAAGALYLALTDYKTRSCT